MKRLQQKTITPEIVAAYARCQRKAYLLFYTSQPGIPNEYSQLLKRIKQAVRQQYLLSLQQSEHVVFHSSLASPFHQHAYVLDAHLRSQQCIVSQNLLQQVAGKSCWGNYHYIPIIFGEHHTVTSTDRLELLFVSYVLGGIQGAYPPHGYVIGLDSHQHKVVLNAHKERLMPILEVLQQWQTDVTPTEPELLLTKHCGSCRFESACAAHAKDADHLSLLDRISTVKMLKKYERKGIFTVKQLSYLYKPRKHKKRKSKTLRHSLELQALALRTEKIYVQELPNFSRQPVEIFLDVEGIPEEDRYYLLGLLLCANNECQYHPFWCNGSHDEREMWERFCQTLHTYPHVPLYHYGHYDAKAVQRLADRYNTGEIPFKNPLVNVNTYIYGKVYFPVYSNTLKALATYLGYSWTSLHASGIQSLVWRYLWEETQKSIYREQLLTYNQEDCEALRCLVEKLSAIQHSAETLSDVDFAQEPKRYSTDLEEHIHDEFRDILNFAHADYEHKKISFRNKRPSKNEAGRANRPQHHAKLDKHVTRTITVPARKFCPKCQHHALKPTNRTRTHMNIDLIVTRSGIRKTAIKYVGIQGWCSICHRDYSPENMKTVGRSQVYGHGIKAWVVYQRVGLRMPYPAILELLEEQFRQHLSMGSIAGFLKELGQYYTTTEQAMMQALLASPVLHVDETPVNIQGVPHYVWVFTNGRYVVLKYTETREATHVHELLRTYGGVLISDFYPGYDAVACAQQKCWVHLIRDLNDDLWKAPFDVEYQAFVNAVRNLIVPIMQAAQKYGLKKRHFNKFQKYNGPQKLDR